MTAAGFRKQAFDARDEAVTLEAQLDYLGSQASSVLSHATQLERAADLLDALGRGFRTRATGLTGQLYTLPG